MRAVCPVAIVGMACRFPDAVGPDRLWDTVLNRRRAFRRLPAQRVDVNEYWHPDPAHPDTTYVTRAAVLTDWRFDRGRFRVPGDVFRCTDPAQWLALETAAAALADAGFADGDGLDRDRVGVVVGNSLTGDVSRAQSMRLRWPYVRRVLMSALDGVPDRDALIQRVAEDYLAPFPPVGDGTLAGGLANTIAGRVCNQFGFRGGGYTVDGACASSLLAVITMCRALADGSIDFAIAGGVDLSLDPFELVGFAKAGALAQADMLVYDERSAGFLPGEGAGMLALMRTSDAQAAGIPWYAEILGWGVASDGHGGITRPEVGGQVLALHRAAAMAGVAQSDIQSYEGHGTGTATGDLVELTALDQVRAGATDTAALGSVKANIGHTKAAAGVAGVLKTTLSLAAGVLPPITGCSSPHPALGGTLRVLDEPEPWPVGRRLAGVSAMGFGGIDTHLVLGTDPAAPRRRSASRIEVVAPAPQVDVIAVSGRDVDEVGGMLRRLMALGTVLSDAETHDAACHFGRRSPAGPVRVALTVHGPADLAARAAVAADRIGTVSPGRLVAAPGMWLGNDVAGRVTLLFPGQGGGGERDTALAQPAIFSAGLAAAGQLARLGVVPVAAIGHSLGEITALVWAGVLSEADGTRLVAARGRIMAELGMPDTGMLAVPAGPAAAAALCAGTGLVVAADNGPRAQVLSGSLAQLRAVAATVPATFLPVSHGFHSPAMAACVMPLRAVLDTMCWRPTGRTVVSTVTGQPVTVADDLADLLARQLAAPVRFWTATRSVIERTDLWCAAGPGLPSLDGVVSVRLDHPAAAAAALFAAGAVPDLARWFAGRSARPFDPRHDPEFLANPCAAAAPLTEHVAAPGSVSRGDSTAAAVTRLVADTVELDPELIRPESRLIGDLGLTSLRVTQLVADAAGRLGRRAPIGTGTDLTVADVITAIAVSPAEDAGSDPAPVGVRPWLGCFTETLVPAGASGPWRPTATLHLPDPADIDAVLSAGRAALRAGTLVVVSPDGAVAGFLRSLRAEHPEVGITLVRGTTDAARWHAEPGRWREIVIGPDDIAREPVERPLPTLPASGALPLSESDVLLVSGGGRGIGHACARALAGESGAALAIIGRADPDVDDELRANLATLHADGIRVGYHRADLTRPDHVQAAVAGLITELGPITGVLHAGGINEPATFDRVDAELVRRHVATKVDGLRATLAAMPADPLRLLITFGSVIGRFGLAGESHYALANGLLRTEAARIASRLPRCRVLHVDWSVWAGTGMGERLGVLRALESAGTTPISVREGTAALLGLLRAGTTGAVSVHGRLGTGTPGEVGQSTGRFGERILVHQPGVEVVAEATLSAAADPWLGGHRLDGTIVLPGVVGLEALAQAAAMVAGRPLTVAERVAFDHPVLVPDNGNTVVRACALRRGSVVETVLRSAPTSYGIDHIRAEFPLSGNENTSPPELVDKGERLSADQLYGPVFFHTGPFRRIESVSIAGARACRATITPDDPWFATVLGPPALNDATVHALQCCVPHRRLLPIACDRVEFTRYDGGPVTSHGRERSATDADYVWDVVALDAADRPAVRWIGLRLRDVGPLPRDRPWPPTLLAVLLERCAHSLGLDPSLRVRVTGDPLAVRVSADRPATVELAGTPAAARAKAVAGCVDRLRPLGEYDGGWELFGSGDLLVASVVVRVAGRPDPIAVAITATGPAA